MNSKRQLRASGVCAFHRSQRAALLGVLTWFGCSSAPGPDGANGSSNASAAATSLRQTRCEITIISAELSPVIGTVGIVAWSTTLASVTAAEIEFGLDRNYGLRAPVDLKRPDFRTLLLGMKENRGPYHFRIQLHSKDTDCVSDDQVFRQKTAPRPSDLLPPKVTTYDAAALAGGFLISVGYHANRPNDYAFILDADGDLVWWYAPETFEDLSTARMSYDGQWMWIGHTNVPSITGATGRIAMDGSVWEDLSHQFKRQHHDLTVLPDETVIYLAHGDNECDDVTERSPEGKTRVIVNSAEAFGNPVVCHGNAVQYSASDDTVIVSDNDHSGYYKVNRQGQIQWVLGGGYANQFDLAGGGASTFLGNHNFQILAADRLLYFNNGAIGLADGVPAVVRELQLDFSTMTSAEVWSYTASPLISSAYLGDVQRLSNGNTLIGYSQAGVIHEVDSSGKLLQQLAFEPPHAIGYFSKRPTLYGPPPR